jgi:kynurenine formamidase
MYKQEKRWNRRPEGSNWGDFGRDDQLGRLNLLNEGKVREGMNEVREGKAFCLSLPLDLPGGNTLNPRRSAPYMCPTFRGSIPNANYELRRDGLQATDVINDDIVTIPTHYSTHWDALSHVGQLFDADGDGIEKPVFYNGYRAGEHVGLLNHDTCRCTSPRLGIEHPAATGLQGRGVMIDLVAHFGLGRTLVTGTMLDRVIRQDGIDVRGGDIICLHTGFADRLIEFAGNPDTEALADTGAVLDGRDPNLLGWITDSNIAAIAADNLAIESLPAAIAADCSAALPLHEHCIFKLGMLLGELWYLTPLARHLRKRRQNAFLLTAPPLRLTGAVGSPTTPVATV